MLKTLSTHMPRTLLLLLVAGMGLVSSVAIATPPGHSTLRNNPLTIEPPAPPLSHTIDKGDKFERAFAEQPPLIPHGIRGYQQDKNANVCLMCHSQENAKRWKATAIPASHLKTETDGKLVLAKNRYFCLLCHVPQADAKSLLDNNFKGADAQK